MTGRHRHRSKSRRVARAITVGFIATAFVGVQGCGWHGVNSVALPGTEGGGPGSYAIQAQLPDVENLQQNSRVRVGDVAVGNVTKIERQGWHALLTMSIDGNVKLPANATATIGQTSLLGSLHIELAPPTAVAPEGTLQPGATIPLASGGEYPSTEQTLAAVSMLLNGGGIGQLQDINQAFSTAFAGRESDVKSLITQLDTFVRYINDQTDDIIAATESFNGLVGQLAAQSPVLDKALKTIPDALTVLKDDREHLTEALTKVGQLSALASDSVNQTKASFVQEVKDVGPVFQSLANAGPALTRSLSLLATYPWPKETLGNWFRGDYANLTGVFDLTLSRLDAGFFTGTRWEGNLTELEMQWGRTIGQLPSPYTAVNPLVVPYHLDQGR
jgi:phospholipid/cholesterol/gamma-HCH transport system substrate-binding protein